MDFGAICLSTSNCHFLEFQITVITTHIYKLIQLLFKVGAPIKNYDKIYYFYFSDRMAENREREAHLCRKNIDYLTSEEKRLKALIMELQLQVEIHQKTLRNTRTRRAEIEENLSIIQKIESENPIEFDFDSESSSDSDQEGFSNKRKRM
jgi:hypothetical protein